MKKKNRESLVVGAVILVILLMVFMLVGMIAWGVIDAEREEDKREELCRDNDLYYETFGCNGMYCCKVLNNQGILCYEISKINEMYYLNRKTQKLE